MLRGASAVEGEPSSGPGWIPSADAVIDVLTDPIVLCGPTGEVVRANPAAKELLGPDEPGGPALCRRLVEHRHNGHAQSVGAMVLATGRAMRDVPVDVDSGGRARALAVDYLPQRSADGTVAGLLLALRHRDGSAAGVARALPTHVAADVPGGGGAFHADHHVLQATIDALSAHLAILDREGTILMTNRAWERFAEENGGPEGVGLNYLAVCDAASGDEHARRAAAGLRDVAAGERVTFTMDYPCMVGRARRWFMLRAARYEGPGAARVVVKHIDVSDQREADDEVRFHAELLDEVDVAVIATDLDRTVTHWNAAAERLYGWTREQARGRTVGDLIVPATDGPPERTRAAIDAVRSWNGELVLRRRDGSTFPAENHSRHLRDADGTPKGFISVSRDVTERLEGERALREARDYLHAVAESMGQGLLTIDVAGLVTYANPAAEAALGWPPGHLAGRPFHSPGAAAGTIVEGPRAPGVSHGVGVATRVEDARFVRRDGSTFPVAYTATPFQTVDEVEGCVVVFEDISERQAREDGLRREVEKLTWIGRIQEALAEDLFVLYAQPIVDVRTGAVVQRELLLRLREPDGTVLGPGVFLPVAEKYGLIGDIDRWVIEQAAALAATGNRVEINISAKSVGDPGILEHFEQALAASGADPGLVVVEITETALVEDEAAALRFVERVHRLGSRLALDDFGTGYGTFTYLKHLPVDYLKIDIEFVQDLVTSRASRHVVEAVVALAKAFDLKTVAEGVEEAATIDLLADLGVDFAQGYFIARPEPWVPEGPRAGE